MKLVKLFFTLCGFAGAYLKTGDWQWALSYGIVLAPAGWLVAKVIEGLWAWKKAGFPLEELKEDEKIPEFGLDPAYTPYIGILDGAAEYACGWRDDD